MRWLIVRDPATIHNLTCLIAGVPAPRDMPSAVDFPFLCTGARGYRWIPYYVEKINIVQQAYHDSLSEIDKIFQVYETDTNGLNGFYTPHWLK